MQYGDFSSNLFDYNDPSNLPDSGMGLSRDDLYQWLSGKYAEGGNTDMLATGIDRGGALISALLGGGYQPGKVSTIGRETAGEKLKQLLGLENADYRQKYMEQTAKEHQAQQVQHERESGLQSRGMDLQEARINQEERKMSGKMDELPPDAVDRILSLGDRVEDFVPMNTKKVFNLSESQSMQVFKAAAQKFGQKGVTDYTAPTNTPSQPLPPQQLDLGPSQMAPTPQPDQYQLKGPQSYEDAQSMPGGPLGVLGQFLQEQMYGSTMSDLAGGKKKSSERRFAGQEPIFPGGQPIPPGASTSPEQQTELKNFTDRSKTIEQFARSALQLNSLIQNVDQSGQGFGGPETLPWPRSRSAGDVPGVGGIEQSIGGALEGVHNAPFVGELAGAVTTPVGNLMTNTTDEGRAIRQLANEMKLMGSNLLLKGTGQISDVERKMASVAIGMDPNSVYADRDIRIGLQRLLQDTAESFKDLKAEHPQIYSMLASRNHPLAQLEQQVNSAYDSTKVLGAGDQNEIEVTAPDGTIYRVHKQWGR